MFPHFKKERKKTCVLNEKHGSYSRLKYIRFSRNGSFSNSLSYSGTKQIETLMEHGPSRAVPHKPSCTLESPGSLLRNTDAWTYTLSFWFKWFEEGPNDPFIFFPPYGLDFLSFSYTYVCPPTTTFLKNSPSDPTGWPGLRSTASEEEYG